MIRFISKNNKLGQFIAQILLLFVLFFTCTEAFCKTLKKFDNGDLQSIEELYEFEIEIQKKSKNSTESDPEHPNNAEKEIKNKSYPTTCFIYTSKFANNKNLSCSKYIQLLRRKFELNFFSLYCSSKDFLIRIHCFIFYEFSFVKNPNYGFFNN